MTSAQVVETSVTNNSSFQDYPHQDDHTIRTIAVKEKSHTVICVTHQINNLRGLMHAAHGRHIKATSKINEGSRTAAARQIKNPLYRNTAGQFGNLI